MPNYKPVLNNGVPLLNASGNPVIYDADLYPSGPPPGCCCESPCPCCTSLPETVEATLSGIGNWDGSYTLVRGDLRTAVNCPETNPCAYYAEEGCGPLPFIVFSVQCVAGKASLHCKLIGDCMLGFPEAEYDYFPSPDIPSPTNCSTLMTGAVLTFTSGSDPAFNESCEVADTSGTISVSPGGPAPLAMKAFSPAPTPSQDELPCIYRGEVIGNTKKDCRDCGAQDIYRCLHPKVDGPCVLRKVRPGRLETPCLTCEFRTPPTEEA